LSVTYRFKVDLYYNGRKLESGDTLLRALIGSIGDDDHNADSTTLVAQRAANLWSATHELQYVVNDSKDDNDMKTNDDNNDVTTTTTTTTADDDNDEEDVDESTTLFEIAKLANNVASIPSAPHALSLTLRLLTLLTSLPSNVGVASNEFENTRLDATLRRQLAEPLLVAGSLLPRWCHALAIAPSRVLVDGFVCLLVVFVTD
jgi:hypothetical protein